VRADRARRWLAGRPHHAGLAALAAGFALAPAPPPAAVGVAAGVALCLAVARLPRLAALAAALVLAGAVAGDWRVAAIDRAAAAAGPPGATVAGLAVVLEPPRRSLYGTSAVIRMQTGRGRGARLLARADAALRWPDGGEVGTIVDVSGDAEPPARGRDFDWPAYLRRKGIAYELKLDTLRATGKRRAGVLGALDSARRRGEVALDAGVSSRRAAIARGMVLGEDERIDKLERDDFRRAGLSHVLAVSGQNVMLLCLLALPLLAVMRAGPRMRVAVPLALIGAYVPLAGAGPSLQRAGVMGAAGLVAVGAGRVASRWYALELAAAVTLAINPRVAGDAGWQLSFAAVAGILVLAPPLQRALAGVPRLLAEGIAMTVAATVATAPLIAHDFGSVSLSGLVANVVALPVVAGVMWIGMLQVALGQLAPVLPLAGAAIAPLGALDGLLIGALEAIVRTFADAPGAAG
jgi:competence protein ComEC